MLEQIIVFATILTALGLFIWGRLRFDLVAILALLVLTLTGIIPADEAFAGFSHDAVIIVAAVLVVSRGMLNSGVVDLVTKYLLRTGNRPSVQVGALSSLVATISSVTSSLGALALLMPVALRMSRRSGTPPSVLLLPLAFGALLGAMVTLIGSAPNIIIASMRTRTGAEPFGMFDYTPVGLGIAVTGLLFMAFVGWRFIPHRKARAAPEDLFKVGEYLTEVRVLETSKVAGERLMALRRRAGGDVLVVGLIRENQSLIAPGILETLRAGDVLLVRTDSETLKTLIDEVGLELVADREISKDLMGSDEIGIIEAVVMPDSLLRGRTVRNLNLRWRYGVNLLAVARQGERLRERLGDIRFREGDVLLLQGATETVQETLRAVGCLPLAERGLRIGQHRRIALAVSLFALALVVAGTGILSVAVTFVTTAVLMVLLGLVPMREVYSSIDLSVIVLIAAMIPIGRALETTGGAQLIASQILALSGTMPAFVALTLVLLVTMILSDILNNAATAVLMAPIAIQVAQGLGVSADTFLMAVAIGASAAFLTPIGHQTNMLVFGPGGYRFGDYWRLGLPLEILLVIVAIPLLLIFWPL